MLTKIKDWWKRKSGLSKIVFIVIFIFAFLVIFAKVSDAIANSKRVEVVSTQETTVNPYEGMTDDEIEQIGYIKLWGEPPAGFRWTNSGDLVANSTEDLTSEEVSYAFIRSLSTLDFYTAQKYSSNSVVCTNYNNYYGADASQSYYMQFLRKMYKQVLLSIEVENAESVALFADSQYILTFNIRALDLTNKDFWLDDKDEIFKNLYTYSISESDSTKANQYLYDYILEYYLSEDSQKRDLRVDLVLDKVSFGGWLVSDDSDLDMLCRYTDGEIVVDYIWNEYGNWVQKKQQSEEATTAVTEVINTPQEQTNEQHTEEVESEGTD